MGKIAFDKTATEGEMPRESKTRAALTTCEWTNKSMKSSAAFMFCSGSEGTAVVFVTHFSWNMVPFSLIDLQWRIQGGFLWLQWKPPIWTVLFGRMCYRVVSEPSFAKLGLLESLLAVAD